jgi:hypothetical protein
MEKDTRGTYRAGYTDPLTKLNKQTGVRRYFQATLLSFLFFLFEHGGLPATHEPHVSKSPHQGIQRLYGTGSATRPWLRAGKLMGYAHKYGTIPIAASFRRASAARVRGRPAA